MAKRIASRNNIFTIKQSFWIYKKLKRKGFIAGKYEICHNGQKNADLVIRETVIPKIIQEFENRELFFEAIRFAIISNELKLFKGQFIC